MGDRWFDSDAGVEYVYITDADGSQWVNASSPAVGVRFLPITVRAGTVSQILIAAGMLPITTRAGSTTNVPVN